MTLRRIHAEQGCTPLGNLEQKQATPDVAILKGLVAKRLLQLVELNQLQGQRTTQKLIAVKLNRMLVQRRERLRNRETMVCGKGAHTLVDEIIHGDVGECSRPKEQPPARLGLGSVACLEPVESWS